MDLLVINACNASLRSDKFSQMAKRTRKQYLLDLVQSSCTSLGVDQIGGAGIAGKVGSVQQATYMYSTVAKKIYEKAYKQKKMNS